METKFLDFLLEQDLEIQLYIGNARCYPNENKKWNIFWKSFIRGHITIKNLTSEQLINAFMRNELPEK